jgi:hypothetical protein
MHFHILCGIPVLRPDYWRPLFALGASLAWSGFV